MAVTLNGQGGDSERRHAHVAVSSLAPDGIGGGRIGLGTLTPTMALALFWRCCNRIGRDARGSGIAVADGATITVGAGTIGLTPAATFRPRSPVGR